MSCIPSKIFVSIIIVMDDFFLRLLENVKKWIYFARMRLYCAWPTRQREEKLTVRWRHRHPLIITSPPFPYITVYYYYYYYFIIILSFIIIYSMRMHAFGPVFWASARVPRWQKITTVKERILLCKRLSGNAHSLARVRACCKTKSAPAAAAFDNGNINLRFATILFVLLTSVHRRS